MKELNRHVLVAMNPLSTHDDLIKNSYHARIAYDAAYRDRHDALYNNFNACIASKGKYDPSDEYDNARDACHRSEVADRAVVTAVIAAKLDYSIFNDDLVTSEDYQKSLDTFFYISVHNIQDYLEEIEKINKEGKKR